MSLRLPLARFAPSALLALITVLVGCARVAAPTRATSPEEVVRGFFAAVRSGAAPDSAMEYLAPRVLAHQLDSEALETVERDPATYAAHVREMQATYGAFVLQLDELFASGDRVYVRWRQLGHHRAPIDGFAPTGKPLTELASAVYRVENGRISEYWIQIDRAGLRAQLEAGVERPAR